MPRKKQPEKITDPFERARLKKLRAAQRREERKRKRSAGGVEEPTRKRQSSSPDYSVPMVKDDYLWIRKDRAVAYANKMLNANKARPFWLSLPHVMGDGVLPVSHFYPCTMFRTNNRAYYGFLFREHRDMFFDTQENARKELTDTIRSMKPNLV